MSRGDALGGALIEGWLGPVLAAALDPVDAFALAHTGDTDGYEPCVLLGRDHEADGRYLLSRADGWDVMNDTTWCRSAEIAEIRLDPTRPEVQHRIADVLRSLGHEVGRLLPVALGGRVGDAVELAVCPSCAGNGEWGPSQGVNTPACRECGGAGKIRRPVPAARVSARLLAASVEGVEQGRGVVRGVLGEWKDWDGAWTRDNLPGMDRAEVYVTETGWGVRGTTVYATTDGKTRGPETGAAGRAAADAAALRLGWALLDPAARDGVRVPGEVPGE